MNRKRFLKLSGLGGAGLGLGGCVSLSELEQLERLPEGAGVQVVSGVMMLAKYRASARQRAQAQQAAAQIIVHRGLVPVAKAKARQVEKQGRRPTRVVAAAVDQKQGGAVDPVEREKLVIDATLLAVAEQIAGSNHGVRVDLQAIQQVAMNPALGQEMMAAVANSLGDTIAVRVEKGASPAEKQNANAVTMMMIKTRDSRPATDNAYVMNMMPPTGRTVELDGIGAVFYS